MTLGRYLVSGGIMRMALSGDGGSSASDASKKQPSGDGRGTIMRGNPSRRLRGLVRVPGDKSISHRALMLSALAVGRSEIQGLLMGDDVVGTAHALQAMGVDLRLDPSKRCATVQGVGLTGLRAPDNVLDLGNSGTSVRLLMGILTGHPFTAVLTGDASLRRRPMGRVATPLRQMGAIIEGVGTQRMPHVHALRSHAEFSAGGAGGAGGASGSSRDAPSKDALTLPLTFTGRVPPMPVVYDMPVASAQLKSAVLLAGLTAPGHTTVVEHAPTRDHTERMLRAMGAKLTSEPMTSSLMPSTSSVSARQTQEHALDRHTDGRRDGRLSGQLSGQRITIEGGHTLRARNTVVPSDISSAAFFIVAGLLAPDSHIVLKGVGCNPTRIGILTTLLEMGAHLTVTPDPQETYEDVADIEVQTSELRGIEVPAARAPLMIDEYPILAVAAALAKGRTTFHGVGELRVKESDRLQAIYDGLCSIGISCEMGADWLTIQGCAGNPPLAPGRVTSQQLVRVASRFDHRIAMAFTVMGLIHGSVAVEVDEAEAVATSFPDFVSLMRSIGGDVVYDPAQHGSPS